MHYIWAMLAAQHHVFYVLINQVGPIIKKIVLINTQSLLFLLTSYVLFFNIIYYIYIHVYESPSLVQRIESNIMNILCTNTTKLYCYLVPNYLVQIQCFIVLNERFSGVMLEQGTLSLHRTMSASLPFPYLILVLRCLFLCGMTLAYFYN